MDFHRTKQITNNKHQEIPPYIDTHAHTSKRKNKVKMHLNIAARVNSRLLIRSRQTAIVQTRTYSSTEDLTPEERKELELKERQERMLETLRKRQEKREEKLERMKAEQEKRLAERVNRWKMQEKLRILKMEHEMKEKAIAERKALREKRTAMLEKAAQEKREKKLRERERKLIERESKPRAAKNPFIMYYTQNFEALSNELRETNPEGRLPVTKVAQLAKERFDALSSEERRVYEHMAEQDRQRYEKERAAYEEEKKRNKRPPTAYMLFTMDVRSSVVEQNPHMSVAEQAKVMGKMWRELDTFEQQKYKDKYAELMEEWREKMKAKEEKSEFF